MSYTVPTTFAAENGAQPAAQLDNCFTAVLAGINNAYLKGTLAARPTPDGIGNGRFYFATDVATFYYDNGSAWLQVAPAVGSVAAGLYGARGLGGGNNPITPNTQMDISANYAQFFNKTTFVTAQFGPVGTTTNDITLAGPAVNGRDQAGAFTNGSWVFFYLIYDPSGPTVATISSARDPGHGGPVAMPGTYSLWCPVLACYLSAGGALLPIRLRGPRAWYAARQSIPSLVDARALVETTVDMTTLIPPDCEDYQVSLKAYWAAVTYNPRIRISAGLDWFDSVVGGQQVADISVPLWIPNLASRFFYKWDADPGATFGLYGYALGYTMPYGAA